jgi:N-acyl amino acid synthase of PEP-CTERM/exosortase system
MQDTGTKPQPGLSEQFRRYFQLVRADTEALRQAVYRIRYQVYCTEMGFEDPARFADGMERDDYDARAMHVLLRHLPSGEYAGSVRLILDSPGDPRELFPFERFCGHSLRRNLIDPARLPRNSFGEISRLAVRGQFRRRSGEQSSPDGVPSEDVIEHSPEQRRMIPHIALGLYLAGAAMGLMQGLSGVFVMMEPRLARHMRRYGIVFRQAGEIVDYHGLRGPFYISRRDLFEHLRPEIRDLLDAITEDLDGVRNAGTGTTGSGS